MATPNLSPPEKNVRPGNGPFYVGVLFLLLFAALVAHQLQAKHAKSIPNLELLADLADAPFLDDKPPSGPHASDWPQWRGQRRDGVAWTDHILTKWPDRGPKQGWAHPAPGGESYSSFAVTAGRLYTMLTDKDGEAVVCWNVDPFKEVWRKSYEPGPGSVEYGNFPRCTPTVDGDQVFTVGPTGRFQCRNAETGDLLWEHDLVKEFQGRQPRWGYSFSPLVLRDRVFASPGGNNGNSIVAFERKTGELLWKTLDDPAGYSSPIAITVNDTEQVVFFTGDSLVGLTVDGGKQLWRYPWETFQKVNAATPIAFRAGSGDQVHQYLYITSGYQTGCALLRVDGDSKTGFQVNQVYTNKRMACHFMTPVRFEDHVYGFNETELTCMNLRTGEVKWKEAGYHKGTLLLARNPGGKAYLLVLGEEGKLALLEATPDEFRRIAESRTPAKRRCWPMPVLVGGRVYLRDETTIFCLRISNDPSVP